MTVLVSGAAPGARIVATVAWYDVAKDYGFLTLGGGLPDIFCHVSALQDVGLDILLQGATVTCEVVQGDRGPQVARIHAVDFSTASVIPASGNGRMREERVSPQVRLPSSDRRIRALVKWFVPTKGYGFLVPEDGSADIFCHGTVVQASGYDVLLQGAMVTCEVVEGRKGVEASRILAVDVPATRSAAAGNVELQHGSPDPEWRDQGADGLPSKFRAWSSSTTRARASASSCPTTAAGRCLCTSVCSPGRASTSCKPGNASASGGGASSRPPGDRGRTDLRIGTG